MKAILICPGERAAMAALLENGPLCNLPVLGKPLIEYWIEHLCSRGAREIYVLATDRPEQVRAAVSDGRRWGVSVTVFPEIREFTRYEAQKKYRAGGAGWVPEPDTVNTLDHFPGFSVLPLFESYLGFVTALLRLLSRAAATERIGLRQIQPGVWAGLHTRVAHSARLIPPCWLGDDVSVDAEAVVGPIGVVEHGSVIRRGAEVIESIVGPDTFVGEHMSLRHSIAWGSTLIDWRTNSCMHVPDAFLVSSLAPTGSSQPPREWIGRLAAAALLVLSFPLAAIPLLKAVARRRRWVRPRRAVRPRPGGIPGLPGDTFVYYELCGVRGWLKRWPQLWSIVRGDLAWVGNRPLEPAEAAQLSNEFERLWFATRPGLLSLADAEQGSATMNLKARAQSSFYSVRANWRLDAAILARALFLFLFGIPLSRAEEWIPHSKLLVRWNERKEQLTWRFNRKASS